MADLVLAREMSFWHRRDPVAQHSDLAMAEPIDRDEAERRRREAEGSFSIIERREAVPLLEDEIRRQIGLLEEASRRLARLRSVRDLLL